MIIGAHSIIYSTNPAADSTFLRDVLELTHVDQGGGWLIFGLPPSEVAVHPSDSNDVHEFYLMCDDIGVFVTRMERHGVACTAVQNRGWGLLTEVSLPGGGKLGVYEPRHTRPEPPSGSGTAPRRRTTRSRRAAKSSARGRSPKKKTKTSKRRRIRTK